MAESGLGLFSETLLDKGRNATCSPYGDRLDLRADAMLARIAELEGEALFHRVLGPQRTESDMNEILSLKARVEELETAIVEWKRGASERLETISSQAGRIAELEAENNHLMAKNKYLTEEYQRVTDSIQNTCAKLDALEKVQRWVDGFKFGDVNISHRSSARGEWHPGSSVHCVVCSA